MDWRSHWGAKRSRTSRRNGSAATGASPGFGGARELKEVSDDAVQAVDLVADDEGIFVGRGAGHERSLQREEPGADGGQRIADFVRDARGEFAEMRHLLMTFDDGVAFDQAAAEREDDATVDDDHQPDAERAEQQQRRCQQALQPREP